MQQVFVLRDESIFSNMLNFLRENYPKVAASKKPLSVVISPYKTRRSNEQNKRYWAILNQIEENGWVNARRYSADVWHEFFRKKFIGQIDLPDGSTIGISTTTLSIPEMADYMTQIEQYAAEELKIIITEPER